MAHPIFRHLDFELLSWSRFAGERGLADKWLMYEESIRVPLIIFDPRVRGSQRGRTVDAVALNLDFAPTMLEMSGVPVPASLQGRSLTPLLQGSRPADWRKDFFYEHNYGPNIIPPSEGIRTERWAYLRWLAPNPESEELYDIQSDPLEQRNLAADPAYAPTLGALRAQWRQTGPRLKCLGEAHVFEEPPDEVEGKSLRPLIQGKRAKVRDWLFGAYKDCQWMVHVERWKLIHYNAGGVKNTSSELGRICPQKLLKLRYFVGMTL